MFIFTVKQGHCAIVEMFGKPTSVRKSGLQFRIPFLQSLRDVSPAWGTLTNKDGYYIELTEQLLDTQPRSCITKDNATMQMNCVVRWRITDPIKAVYEVERLHQSLIELVLNEMRSLIGSRNLDEILSSRTEISELVTVTVASTADAESAYLAQLAAIVGAEAAAKILMNRQALEGYATITTNPASTVYLPNSVPAVIDLKQK